MASLKNLAPAIFFTPERKVAVAAPYPITWRELHAHFGRSPHRQQLLKDMGTWVSELSEILAPQFIWIGGSFVTDKPEPKDIDAVIFYRYVRPDMVPAELDDVLRANAALLNHARVQERFRIDSALVPLDVDVAQLIHASAYWAMVFSNDEHGGRRAFYTLKWEPNFAR
jgi:hypothetical protein